MTALPYRSLWKVEANEAVKSKPLFVALSALGFHQHGWQLSHLVWGEAGKACDTLRVLHTAGAARQPGRLGSTPVSVCL